MSTPYPTPFHDLDDALDAVCDYAFGNAVPEDVATFEADPDLAETLLQVRFEEARNSYERYTDIQEGNADLPAYLRDAPPADAAREIGRKKSGARAFWRTISTKIAEVRARRALAERGVA